MDEVEHLVVESKKGQILKHLVLVETVIDVIRKGTCLKPVEFQLPSFGVRNVSPKTITQEQNGAKEKIEYERTLATGKTPVKVTEGETAPENEADTEIPQMTVTVLAEHNLHHRDRDNTGHPHQAIDIVTFLRLNIRTDRLQEIIHQIDYGQ